MDATKEQWLRQLYGDAAVNEMLARIARLGKSMGVKAHDDEGFMGMKAALVAGARQGMMDAGFMPSAPTSWAELDAAARAGRQGDAIASVDEQLALLFANITNDATMTPAQRADALAAVVVELPARLNAAIATKAIADDPVLSYCELAGATGIREVALVAAKSGSPRQPTFASLIRHAAT